MSWSLIYIDSTTSQMYASVKWISAAVELYQITQHTRHGTHNDLNHNIFLRFWLLHLVCATKIFLTLDKTNLNVLFWGTQKRFMVIREWLKTDWWIIGYINPAPLVTHVVLLLNYTNIMWYENCVEHLYS